MQETIGGVKVVLTGEGADEIAWGYDIFREAKVRRFVARNPLSRIRPHLFVAPEESFVADGESEIVPARSKAPSMPRSTGTSVKAQQIKEPININRAGLTELQKLPGIGPKLSQRILDERAKASFKSIEELRRVPGIGAKTLEKLRPHVTID